jgi:hypothetical protein
VANDHEIKPTPAEIARAVLDLSLLYTKPENAKYTPLQELQHRLIRNISEAAIIATYAFLADNPDVKKNYALFHNGRTNLDHRLINTGMGIEQSVKAALAISRYSNPESPQLISFEKVLEVMALPVDAPLPESSLDYPLDEHLNGIGIPRSHGDGVLYKTIGKVNQLLKPFFQIVMPLGGDYKQFDTALNKLATEKNGKLADLTDLCRASIVYENTSLRRYLVEAINQIVLLTKDNPKHSINALDLEARMQRSGYYVTYGIVALSNGTNTLPTELQVRHIAMQRIEPITHMLHEAERAIDTWLEGDPVKNNLNGNISFTKQQLIRFNDKLFLELELLDQDLFTQIQPPDFLQQAYQDKKQTVQETLNNTKLQLEKASPNTRDVASSMQALKQECWEIRQLLHVYSVAASDIDPEYQIKYVTALTDKILKNKSEELSNKNFTFIEPILQQLIEKEDSLRELSEHSRNTSRA